MPQPLNDWERSFSLYSSSQSLVQTPATTPRPFGSNAPHPPFANPILVTNRRNQAFIDNISSHLNIKYYISLYVTLTVLFVGIAIYMSALWLADISNDNLLEKSGVTTQAQVINSFSTTSKKGGTTYDVTYSFVAPKPNGSGETATYQQVQLVDKSTYDTLSLYIGAKVDIKYLKSNPTISEIPNQGTEGEKLFAELFIAILLFAAGLGLVWLLFSDWRLNKLLEQKGYLIEARIESVQFIRTGKVTRIQCSFLNPQGQFWLKDINILNYGGYQKHTKFAPGVLVGLVYYDDKHFKLM